VKTQCVNAALAVALDTPLVLVQLFYWICASHYFRFYQNIFVVAIYIVEQKAGVF
jgi:hypothetical protein